MANLILVLGEQLNLNLAALREAYKPHDEVLMVESARIAETRTLHRQKLAYVWASMREFSRELDKAGYRVNYITEDKSQHKTFKDIVTIRVLKGEFAKVIATTPLSHSTLKHLQDIGRRVPLELKPHNMFLIPDSELAAALPDLTFAEFFKAFKPYLSFANRQQAGAHIKSLQPSSKLIRLGIPASPDTKLVLKLVTKLLPHAQGATDDLGLPTSIAQAQTLVSHIVADTELLGTKISALDAALNSGIITPDLILAQIQPHTGEGVNCIREHLLIREYYHYLYLSKSTTLLKFAKDLPKTAFEFAPFTEMACLQSVLQKLSVPGSLTEVEYMGVLQNLMLLMETKESDITSWFTSHTMTPNWLAQARVSYALSTHSFNAANYISLNTPYAGDPEFNYLFWNFLADHKQELGRSPQLKTHFQRLKEMPADKRSEIQAQAEKFLQTARKHLTFRQVPAAGKN